MNSGTGDPRWACRCVWASVFAFESPTRNGASPGGKEAISRAIQVIDAGVSEVTTGSAQSRDVGPSVNGDGQVVGVNSSALRDEADFNLITDTSDLRPFLVSRAVVPAQSSAPRAGRGVRGTRSAGASC
jgi:hypothetical protein